MNDCVYSFIFNVDVWFQDTLTFIVTERDYEWKNIYNLLVRFCWIGQAEKNVREKNIIKDKPKYWNCSRCNIVIPEFCKLYKHKSLRLSSKIT